MRTEQTWTATIYCGFRERYTGEVRAVEMAHDVIQNMTDEGGLCVSVTPTTFIYKNGKEPGVAVGLIQYPRFPEPVDTLKAKAIRIAEELMCVFKQLKVSVVFPDETVMLESEPNV